MYSLTDPKDNFIEVVSSLISLDDTARMFLREQLRVEAFPKNAILIHSNQVIDRLYFVHSGLARGYQLANDEQITTSFFKPSSFIYSPHSFLSQSPAREAVEMLEYSTVAWLSYNALQEFSQLNPGTIDLGFCIANYHAAIFDERLLAIRTLDGIQLYQWFLNRHPDLYGRISHKKLASFLGMSHENLSRILTGRIRKGTSAER